MELGAHVSRTAILNVCCVLMLLIGFVCSHSRFMRRAHVVYLCRAPALVLCIHLVFSGSAYVLSIFHVGCSCCVYAQVAKSGFVLI